MRLLASFAVLGNPIPCERPRVYRGRAFTPRRSKEYQKRVRDAYCLAEAPACYTVPLAVTVTFWRDSRRRCDLDNLQKSVLDALNGIAYEDDSQIVRIVAEKRFDTEHPRAWIEIWSVDL